MLSLLLLCLPALGGGDPEPASPDSWRELDDALARLGDDSAGPYALGALVRTFFTKSAAEASAGSADVSGVVFEDVDVWAAAHLEGVDLRVSADFDRADSGAGNARLEDAWARWLYGTDLALTFGQFKPRVVRSGSLPDSELLFRDRTFLGAAFDGWDTGVELSGHYDQFDWWLALANGANGDASRNFWSARSEWALYDEAFDDVEGARGSPNHLCVLFGTTIFSDDAQSSSKGGGYGADLALTFGPYAFHTEWMRLGDQFARTIDVFNGHPLTIGDGQPFSATWGRLLGTEAEAAVRFERADDADNTSSWGLAGSYFPGGGPVRLVADAARVEGDTRDFTLFSIGIQLGSSGLSRPFLDARGTH